MRERSPQDQVWNNQKELSAEHNKLLAKNVFHQGRFLRSTISAGKALRAIIRLSQKQNTPNFR